MGGLLVLGAVTLLDHHEDEERPPIIVKNGSLIFESGDSKSEDPEEKTGKPWHEVGNEWQPDHPEGKKVKWFSVGVQGPGGCPALAMTKQVTVTYKNADGTETDFVIKMSPRGPGGTDSPAIAGGTLTANNSIANPTLTYGTAGQGAISRVRFQGQGIGNVECPDPISLRIWQH